MVVVVVVVDDDVLAVVVVGGVGVGVTPAAFFSRQIGGVFACFCNSRSKKTS